jgi:peptidyl-Asp metalloendopeptidase
VARGSKGPSEESEGRLTKIAFPTRGFVGGALCLSALLTPIAAAQTVGETDPLSLFASRGEAPERPVGVLRSRSVDVDLELLSAEGAVVLELGEDLTVLATRDEARSARAGSRAWLGDVAGSPKGDVCLVRRGDALVGTVRANGQLYRVRPGAEGHHLLELVDETLLPGCAGDPSASDAYADTPGSGGGSTTANTPAAGVPEIDMLVVYTPTARIVSGGTDGVLALIDLAELETNQAFANSGIDAAVRVVHTAELTGYAESSSFGTELSRLRLPGDGYMDEIHGLRDLYGADQVTLIVGNESSCGMAYVQDTPASWFDQLAFSVVSRNCATGYYSFAHELGHNLGCQHDYENAGNGAYSFSYGYRSSGNQWRTIMAYAPGARIQHFSSPMVNYSGEATGVAEGGLNPADNAETIRILAAAMADFRDRPLEAYGEGKLSSLGAYPQAEWIGAPSASGAGFQLRMTDAVPGQGGVVHYSSTPAQDSFMGGTLLASLPLARLTAFRVEADGTVTVDVPVSATDVGSTRYYQFLFRDPGQPSGPGVAMSNGVRARFLP